MHGIILISLLALAACASGPPEFSKPADNAPVWNLNAGEWPGTNAQIQPPIITPEAPGAR